MKKIQLRSWQRLLIYLLLSSFFLYLNPGLIEKSVSNYENFMKKTKTHRYIREIALILEEYHREKEEYPAREELDSLLAEHFKEERDKQIPIDKWGLALNYETREDRQGFKLTSAGKDRIYNTGDDFGFQMFFEKGREKQIPGSIPAGIEP